jgi:triosephosphate isomerase
MERMLIVNLKAYEHGTGRKARYIADIVSRLPKEKKVRVVLAAQPTDIERLATKQEVFAQHIDPVSYGSRTGHILPEAIKEAGAKGTLINHSERSLSNDEIKARVDRAKNVGLTTVVCAPTAERAEELAMMNPDYIAIEPPELIGGDVSVSKANPDLIEETVRRVRTTNPAVKVLAGAGVNSRNDVMTALALGAVGVLVASAVVKSDNPEAALKDLMEGF